MNVGRNKKEIYRNKKEEENRDFISNVMSIFVDGREKGKHSFSTAEYYPIFRVCKEENWDFILNVSFRYSWTEEKESTAEHYPNYLEYAKKKNFVSYVSFRGIEERKRKKRTKKWKAFFARYLMQRRKKIEILSRMFRFVRRFYNERKRTKKGEALVLHC